MECDEMRYDMRNTSAEEHENGKRLTEQLFQLNHTMPMSTEYATVLKKIFGNKLEQVRILLRL